MTTTRKPTRPGDAEWKVVNKAKAERVKARKAWEAAQETCVLFVAGSATETAAYVKLAELRALLLEAGEALGKAEAAYDNAYNAWYHAMHKAANKWETMTEDEQMQAKSTVVTTKAS